MSDLDKLTEAPSLAAAREVVVGAAASGGLAVAVAMVDAALSELERVAPRSDGQVWECYASVLSAQPQQRRQT